MYFGLKYKLIITFITVQTVLTFCVGYYQYQQQWPLLVSQSKANHKNIAQQLVNTVSLSIEGNNYANIYLPTFISQLKSISSLVYLDVDGLSERQKKYQFSTRFLFAKTGNSWFCYLSSYSSTPL